MNKKQINNAISEYKEHERLEIINRENYREQIKYLETLIQSSFLAPIYKLIYKEEYGDYRQFVEIIAKELREINKK